MKSIRISKDITVRWIVKTNGKTVSLKGRDLTVVVTNNSGNKLTLPFVIDNTVLNLISFVFYGTDQPKVGTYSVTLYENYGKANQSAVDSRKAFKLVATTDEEDLAEKNNITSNVTLGLESDIFVMGQGLSAYEIAVLNGYSGTESEWIASLKGDKGDTGATGATGPKGDKGDKGEPGGTTIPTLTYGKDEDDWYFESASDKAHNAPIYAQDGAAFVKVDVCEGEEEELYFISNLVDITDDFNTSIYAYVVDDGGVKGLRIYYSEDDAQVCLEEFTFPNIVNQTLPSADQASARNHLNVYSKSEVNAMITTTLNTSI